MSAWEKRKPWNSVPVPFGHFRLRWPRNGPRLGGHRHLCRLVFDPAALHVHAYQFTQVPDLLAFFQTAAVAVVAPAVGQAGGCGLTGRPPPTSHGRNFYSGRSAEAASLCDRSILSGQRSVRTWRNLALNGLFLAPLNKSLVTRFRFKKNPAELAGLKSRREFETRRLQA